MPLVNNSLRTFGLLVAMAAFSSTLRAQEVFRASWTIQDRAHGLSQDIARDVIERANDWLTKDDPDQPVARLDDPLRVTIVGEISPVSGLVQPRLRRLVMGTIVIDTSFGEFLPPEIITNLVRRDHLWRDEQLVIYNEALSPISPVAGGDADSISLRYSLAFSEDHRSRFRIALDESSYRVSDDMEAWAGFGYEEIMLPDFSYGRIRAGITYDALRIWGEIPAAAGSHGNVFLARGLEGAYGLGVSFEDRWLGGGLSIADISERIGPAAVNGDTTYYLAKAATLYGTLPIQLAMLDYMPLRVKVGVLYHQAGELPAPGGDGPREPVADALNRLRLMARIEYAAVDDDGSQRRRMAIAAAIAADTTGTSIMASYQERISSSFGVRVAAAAHGLFGRRDPFLPPFSVTISPIISIW